MPSRRLTKKTIKGKEGVHPGSRKAGQLARVSLRTLKLQAQAKDRKELKTAKLFRPTFFLHSLSSASPLSLPSLRALIVDVYLARNDARLHELEAERRPGRPKFKELVDLEEIKRVEWAEWETGFEVPDLTHGPTVRLMYSLLEQGVNLNISNIPLLRHVRIPRLPEGPEGVVVSRPGKWENMGLGSGVEGQGEDWTDVISSEMS
ncbi:hypothetical protein TREMEDRAFT_59788 [Tremella mesenterica DSM 1558]|uniref:uncharacterized protein n=1 Tax=Tremella mesenterica (strain ATCC 24925 / CBS 8224 / DSM 1558 / NBRC 9311 / NRRL Y-6157 / RJB 2259-6 / UBC 559-6) TaxID=578456 RepID=UPI0003F499F3|nr:uncharacterized protein TREMEDRAFT_59788 [Tremella mesenterica DSM 1558]EIW73612.1 hypothetical protein TREMEDRAFT_59788 [Tremella mesenterica DSM 1558]